MNRNDPGSARTVILCGPFSPAAAGILEGAGLKVLRYPEFTSGAGKAAEEASALVVRSRTPVTADLMDRCPRLRVIGRPGSGTELVDEQAAAARGIAVVSAAGANAETVAEHTFGLILALIRRLEPLFVGMREGRWEKTEYEGSELIGRTLLLIGLGHVGTEVARRARAFGVHLLACDPHRSESEAAALGVELAVLDEALPRADIVSLHLPLIPETGGLLDARRLALLPRGALVVNTARGALVDEEALLDALETGQLGGAALDTHFNEPPGRSALLRHPRVIATPHVAGAGPRARERAALAVAESIVEILTGRE
jgi:D-3-phosphoglycerate dehydrogenase